MELEDAKAFVDIVEAKSLSRAARARGVAQSTLGRTVDRLEAGFGVRLLDRSPRALGLTAAGERFLVEARSLVAHAAGVERSMRELGRTPRGVVRASLCSGYARHRLLPALGRFAAAHEDVHLDITFGDDPPDLVANGLDLAVRVVPVTSEAAVVTKLPRYAHLLVASPGYLARYGTPSAPAELASHAAIAMRTDRSWTRWSFRNERVDQEVRVRPRIEVNDVDALLALTLAGAGLTVLPSYVASAGLASGHLVQVLAGFTLPSGQPFVVHPGRRHMSAVARALLVAIEQASASAD
jgi:DNA-binding transcriptional LysR family regulator